MLLDGFQRIFTIIFGNNSQQYAQLLQFKNKALEVLINGTFFCRSKGNTSNTIFTNNTTPQSVI